jgi:hypothetical protein
MKTYLFPLIFFCFISCTSTDKSYIEHYNGLISTLNFSPVSLTLQNYFDEFYLKNGYYPNSMQEFFDVMEWEEWYIDDCKVRIFRDPYLINNSIWENEKFYTDDGITVYEYSTCSVPVADSLLLHYCPIYDRNSDLPISFVLLSVGEDRMINSKIAEKLYTDNWEKQIKVHNKKKFLENAKKITCVAYPVFFKRHQEFSHIVICFDKATFDSKQITLCGDTLFHRSSFVDENNKHFKPLNAKVFDTDSLFDENDRVGEFCFFYPEYSRYRAVFGKKDYIVASGREFIKYEIITE